MNHSHAVPNDHPPLEAIRQAHQQVRQDLPSTSAPTPSEPPAPAQTIKVTLSSLAARIDHALLHPTLTDADISAGLAECRAHGVAAACVPPHSVPAAAAALRGSGVAVCAVVGFPHGGSTTAAKAAEAAAGARAGAAELDVVVNLGKVRGGDWAYVRDEVRAVRDAAEAGAEAGNGAGNGAGAGAGRALVKVIFETGFLSDEQVVRLCGVCTDAGVDFVKTSTGFGFVRRRRDDRKAGEEEEAWVCTGATERHLRLMRQHVGPGVKVKASGGVRTLDGLLRIVALGVERVGTSATASLLAEARARGISDEECEIAVPDVGDQTAGQSH